MKNVAKSVTNRKLKQEMYSNFLPNVIQHDDLYLVEFPKSGVTWLTFLMGNIHFKMNNIDQKVTFFNVENITPDIQDSQWISPDAKIYPGIRVIKSHSVYNPYYRTVVYLVRNPKDVMVSGYHFRKGINEFTGDMSEFIRSKKYGIDNWNEHVESWLSKADKGQKLYILKYEDLKTNLISELDQLYGMLGVDVPSDVLTYAMDASSLTAMRENEEKLKSRGRSSNLTFVRKGIVNGYKSELSDDDIRYLDDAVKEIAPLVGYDG